MKALDPSVTTPPIAARKPVTTTYHGHKRVDDYAWLSAKNDPAVTAYLEAENAYTAAVMKPTEGLQHELYDEMLAHIEQTDLSVPYRLGGYFYYARTEEGKQYPIYARKQGSLDAPEEVTLDLNVLAEGHVFLGIGAYQVSEDGNLLAYSVDTTGYRQYVLHVKELRTGADLGEAIERVDSVVWASDNRTMFYVTEDPVSKRQDSLFSHELGSDAYALIYEERDERYALHVDHTRDRRFILLGAYSKSTTETRYMSSDRPTDGLHVFLARREGHRYGVEHHGDQFYIVTNQNAADFRIVAAPERDPQEINWREVVPQRSGVHIDDLDVFETFAVVRGRSGGFPNLEVLDLATGMLQPVELPEAVHAVAPAANPEYLATSYRFAYQSLVTPNSVFEIDIATGGRTLLKQTEVPGYDPSLYATELQHATARDGTAIPISLVYRKDRPRDGSAPLLLSGYGSYGVSIDPTFSAPRLVLLDRGVAFAIAHVRGGGELGEAWRTSGHLMHKLNTFTDFIDGAEFLIRQRYTSPARLAATGGSAGGLLMGAVANERPELFGAIVAQVPFFDVLTTMLDSSLPLTTSEYLEWGDPTEKAAYEYMLRYSPYENLKGQAYPAMLVKVSLNDSQVMYWEGAKYVAKLRTLKTDRYALLLQVNFGAGHGGASGRYDALKETAFTYAFILSEAAKA